MDVHAKHKDRVNNLTQVLDRLLELHRIIHQKRTEIVYLSRERTPENEQKVTTLLRELADLAKEVKDIRSNSLGPLSKQSRLNLEHVVESAGELDEELIRERRSREGEEQE